MKNINSSIKIRNYSQSILGGDTINFESTCISIINSRSKTHLKHIPKFQKCYPKRPCKKMTCRFCVEERRCSFIKLGVDYLSIHNLRNFLTVSFDTDRKRTGYEWDDLFLYHDKIWKLFYRHPSPKYIRCLALGNKDEKKHIHIIMNQHMSKHYLSCAKKSKIDLTFELLDVWDAEGVLGYMYDQNFIPSHIHYGRPYRARLLTASKGLRCGFPATNT